MGKFKSMLKASQSFQLELANGTKQELIIKSLPAEYLPDVMFVFGKMTGLSGADASDPAKAGMEFIKSIDKETIDVATELCKETLKHSYRDEPEDEIDQLVADYFLQIFMMVMQVNMPAGGTDETQREGGQAPPKRQS